jgi:hypothetical protein
MRRLAFLPLLMLALGCSDSTLFQPEPNLTVVASDAAQAQNAVVHMVPFTAHNGSWWTGDSGFGCEGSDDNLWGIGPGVINVAHLGRSDYSALNCWALDATSPMGMAFISQTGWVEAANGDRLFWYGSADMGSTATFDLAELTYEMGPFWFTGGTGRFEGVTGEFTARGTLAADFATGTENWDGVISSVGGT